MSTGQTILAIAGIWAAVSVVAGLTIARPFKRRMSRHDDAWLRQRMAREPRR